MDCVYFILKVRRVNERSNVKVNVKINEGLFYLLILWRKTFKYIPLES